MTDHEPSRLSLGCGLLVALAISCLCAPCCCTSLLPTPEQSQADMLAQEAEEAALEAIVAAGAGGLEAQAVQADDIDWDQGAVEVLMRRQVEGDGWAVNVANLLVVVHFHRDEESGWTIDDASIDPSDLARLEAEIAATQKEALQQVTLSSLAFNWHADGVELVIAADHDAGFRLGMVENDPHVIGQGWTGESCGIDDEGLCHPIKTGVTRLHQTLGSPGQGKTRFAQEHAGCLSFVLRHESGQCWTWGKDTAAYQAQGCVLVEERQPEDACDVAGRRSRLGKGKQSAPPPPKCRPLEACCKLCGMGQACGDTCIDAGQQCHVGRGCACDDASVCR